MHRTMGRTAVCTRYLFIYSQVTARMIKHSHTALWFCDMCRAPLVSYDIVLIHSRYSCQPAQLQFHFDVLRFAHVINHSGSTRIYVSNSSYAYTNSYTYQRLSCFAVCFRHHLQKLTKFQDLTCSLGQFMQQEIQQDQRFTGPFGEMLNMETPCSPFTAPNAFSTLMY